MIVRGYKPHRSQLFLHDKMNEENHFYYTFNIGRQWGKTMMLINQMFYWGFNRSGTDIAFIAPTLKQSRRVLLEMIKYAGDSKFIKFNKSELSAEFHNGSKILFLSSEQGDALRGFHFHYIVRDESAHMPNGFYHLVIAPMLIAKGIKDISISTPKGRNSDHFTRYSQAMDNELYYSHNLPSSDNPHINKIILADIKKQTPEHIWRQEYLAEFLDGGTLFKNIDKCILNGSVKAKGNIFGGLDIGRADDYTVLTLIDENNNVLLCERWRHLEWHQIVSNVAKLIKQYQAVTFVEVNNQGDVFFELLQDQVGKNLALPFYTSNKSKGNIMENLIVEFEEKSITIPDLEWLKMELESYTYVYTPSTRRVRYGAPNGLHDDGVDSLALALESKNVNRRKGHYVIGY